MSRSGELWIYNQVIYEYYFNLLWILLCMIWYLCNSLWTIGLVWPTRLVFLAMERVLSFGFNHEVLDPSDSRGNDTYCIVAIEDKKMGFISYCLSLLIHPFCIMLLYRYLLHYGLLLHIMSQYLCLFSLILQGLHEEGECRQLEFRAGKGANIRDLFCTTPKVLKLHGSHFWK